MLKDVLGIDIGGVIIRKVDTGADTSFLEDFLKTPTVEGAIESIRDIISLRFGPNVHLVSKCGPQVEALTWQWLDSHLFPQSGLLRENVHFCREREQKAAICQTLDVTHFIDDRLEVLSYLKTVETLYLFQPREDEVRQFAQALERVRRVSSWKQVREDLI